MDNTFDNTIRSSIYMENDKSKKATYRRCKYIIESSHEKYLKMPINAIFVTVDDHLVPLPVDNYANVVKIKNKKKQQMFSNMISNMNPKDKEKRTLALST
jgi:hypothetical protein